ncbi:hypothetical protein GCM10007977_000820 [Dactylosporangium sucinum]|uniref:Uncharacterized protein n=1 Tax=Dactylosporangium sucinum TaxID=1424081 RepID=A0A917SZC2_9ACTN|nr:hypothetical protein GCM10007977_000820 [Dactylosporangium sucinum]
MFISAWVSPPTGACTVGFDAAGAGAADVAFGVGTAAFGTAVVGACVADAFGWAPAEDAGCGLGGSALRCSPRAARFSVAAERSGSPTATVSARITGSGRLADDIDTNTAPIAAAAMAAPAEYSAMRGRPAPACRPRWSRRR